MGVVVSNGIGYGTNTKAAFYTEKPDGKAISTPQDFILQQTASPWSWWGDGNNEPTYIKDDIENCGVLSAGVEAEARLAVGKGIDAYLLLDKQSDGTEVTEWVHDTEVNYWLEENDIFRYSYQNIYNQIAYGWGATQFNLSQDRTRINRIAATDVFTARMEKRNVKTGSIDNLYLCGDWNFNAGNYDPDKMRKIPMLQDGYELKDLGYTKSGYEFGMLHRLLKNGRLYYPVPPHRSAKAWVKISRSIPGIKEAINTQQMVIKYLIIIADTYWERIHKGFANYPPEKKQPIVNDVYDKINSHLAGEVNAGKSIIAGRYYDPYNKTYVDDITIQVIDDKMKEGKMLPDSAAADKQILFSMFFNPAIWGGNLLGDGASGGAGSGSDIREATLVLMMLLHPERSNNLKVLNLVKKYNGWADRLEVERDIFAVTNYNQGTTARKIKPRLVFRYSSSILTTLDTGGSQKPVTN